ncbi:MAG: reductive dehalogenase [candidate division Zixibacteria bacterium]|nr:reductive dehalogenase [candidate division Zixibacteria bacterium]
MSWLLVLYFIAGGALSVLLILMATSSMIERRPRAAYVSLIFLVFLELAWYGMYIQLSEQFLAIPLGAVVLVALLFFSPVGRTKSMTIGQITHRVDERDVVFSREEYFPDDQRYNQYYSRRPELKEIDDRMRTLPELLEPGGRYYDPIRTILIDRMFDVIVGYAQRVDGPVKDERVEVPAEQMTVQMKKLIRNLGADDVGIATLNPMWVYSHVGRGTEPWGTHIENNHKFAIVFCFEMDYERVEKAPGLPLMHESALRYLQSSQISTSLAHYIRSLGYPARAHVSGSNYQIMLPPVAHDAGLGELGRMGYLISPKFGPRFRLGAVTTDLPLIPDKPIVFGVQDFCAKCLKCVSNCPSGAIPKGTTESVYGVEKWPLNVEKCIHYWRRIGTDCGLCMRACPYSHPPTLVHNIVRSGLKRSAFARTVSVWGDDLLYGRKLKYDRGQV